MLMIIITIINAFTIIFNGVIILINFIVIIHMLTIIKDYLQLYAIITIIIKFITIREHYELKKAMQVNFIINFITIITTTNFNLFLIFLNFKI